jgi:hypothetical protein
MSEAIDITSIGRSHGRLTGPIFLRAVDQLHLLEFHSARSKDWPVNRPTSLLELRRQVDALIPRVDLPEAILEVQAWTGFPDEFHHVSERATQVEDLALSVCAVLTAEACNINLEPVVRNEIPALSYARLAWVQQNHIRAETLSSANARLA